MTDVLPIQRRSPSFSLDSISGLSQIWVLFCLFFEFLVKSLLHWRRIISFLLVLFGMILDMVLRSLFFILSSLGQFLLIRSSILNFKNSRNFIGWEPIRRSLLFSNTMLYFSPFKATLLLTTGTLFRRPPLEYAFRNINIFRLDFSLIFSFDSLSSLIYIVNTRPLIFRFRSSGLSKSFRVFFFCDFKFKLFIFLIGEILNDATFLYEVESFKKCAFQLL